MSIREELLALQQADAEGLLKVEVAHSWAAAHPKSALYNALDWDDARAGRKYRYDQIRHLVRMHVLIADNGPQLVSLSFDRYRDGGGYRDINDVAGNQRLSEILLQDALNELERVQRKFQAVSELVGVWTEIEKAKGRIKRQRRPKSPDAVLTA